MERFDLLGPLPGARRWVAEKLLGGMPAEEMVDQGWKLLSNERPVRFNEMEFHLPVEAQIPALKEVVATIEAKRNDVFFPIEVRSIAADDAWLSPFYQRESGSVAVARDACRPKEEGEEDRGPTDDHSDIDRRRGRRNVGHLPNHR